jgi:hypothetical protein
MKKNKIIIALLFSLIFVCNSFGASFTELLSLGENQAEVERSLENETKNYNKILKAIKNNIIKEGLLKDNILNEYGQPSVIVPGNKGSLKAVYKPSYANYFDKEKITLFFNNDNKIQKIKVGQ